MTKIKTTLELVENNPFMVDFDSEMDYPFSIRQPRTKALLLDYDELRALLKTLNTYKEIYEKMNHIDS